MNGKMEVSGLTGIIPLAAPQLSGARVLRFPLQSPLRRAAVVAKGLSTNLVY